MFEKKGPAADPFPKKTPGSAIGGSRASMATAQPEAKIEAPQAQSVSNLKSVFGFEKKPAEGGSTLKVGPPPAKAAEPSWVKKPVEDSKALATTGLKPATPAPANNPFKKADTPVETAPVAPPKPVEVPKPVEQPKPSPF